MIAVPPPGGAHSSALCFVFGGARSGKSAYAEARTLAFGHSCVYLATAEALDGEMEMRIAHHRARRGSSWRVIEEPLDLPGALERACGPERAVLVDCLTLWLSNLLGAERVPEAAFDALTRVLKTAKGPVVLVSNDVGSGVVPMNALSRRFVDETGRLHQQIARLAGEVVHVQVGLPLVLKGAPPRLNVPHA